MSEINLFNMNCYDYLENYNSEEKFDLILTDPPYGTVKNLRKNLDWDNSLDFERIFKGLNNVTKKNSKVVLFAQEPFTSKLIQTYDQHFKFNYKAIWLKNNSGNAFNASRAHLNFYEEIVIYTKKHDINSNSKLRKYASLLRVYLQSQKFNATSSYDLRLRMAHFFASESIQFCLCSEKTYNELISQYKIDRLDFFKSYDDLLSIKINYESTFNLEENQRSKSNVLQYSRPTDYFHPTQKPVDLLEDLIKTFTNKGDRVLDFTMGSGSTGVACKNTNRNFTGIELNKEYFEIAKKRLS